MGPKVVIDTNALIQAVPSGGRYRPIIVGLRNQRFQLILSNEIMTEYEEVISRSQNGREAWEGLRRLIDLLYVRTNVIVFANPTYRWRLIRADPDDDKFVDAAVCKEGDWIVTEDKHFNVLNRFNVFAVRPLHPRRFIQDYCQEG